MEQYSSIIHRSRYARYLPELKRRETWEETVERLINYLQSKHPDILSDHEQLVFDLYDAIIKLEVMPSMRLLMVAGEACERDNISAYNCAYLAVNNKRAFSEALYILMNGTGVGFSCERQEIADLPTVPADFKETDDVIVVKDSKKGWALAYKKLLSSLWEGDIPKIDYSKVRPAGDRLKTFGGRASGPEPLQKLFEYSISVFSAAAGRKLHSLEVHDIMCTIGEVVVVGGVRRSALISLSNLTDRRMREAKVGAWWTDNGQRALANNSVAYTEKPDVETFMEEWLSLVKSKSGERGIFNRVAAQNQAAKWGRRDSSISYGCNPCSEILLRDKQFCNLTEVVVRSEDNLETLKRKVELATILGTIQSTLTNFQFLSEDWKKNTEEERLLGVSLTGIMDNSMMNGSLIAEIDLEKKLGLLRDHARETNKKWAALLGIPESAAITCVKPSGTVSELVGSAPGIHSRHSRYYIRSIRQDNKDPLTAFLKASGVPWEPAFGKEDSTTVFSFPVASPEGAVLRDDRTAIQQLEHWILYQRHWCEHKPSVTITVRDSEWMEVGAWVFEYFDEMSGVSFLPHSDHIYKQAPFQECSEEEYSAAVAKMPNIEWGDFHETDDNTISSQELACTAGGCTI